MEKKYNILSLIHQFYKELIRARKLHIAVFPLLKYLPTYLIQNRYRHNRLEMGIPWIVKESKEYLDNYIKPGQKVFEFGSGASSYYFLKNGLNLVSVEHDRLWYEKVDSFLKLVGLKEYSLNLIEPVKVSPMIPVVTSLGDPRFTGFDYSNYSKYIDRFPDRYFDIVFIDGRVRLECLRNSLQKIKEDGILIFDNSERIEYSKYLKEIPLKCVFKKFGIVEYDLWLSETSIFKSK